MDAESIKALVQKHLDAEAAHDPGLAASFYTRDGEYFIASMGLRFGGRDAVAGQYARSYESFPDLEATIDGEAAGLSSFVHWGRLRGTLTGTFAGLPATSKAMDTGYISIYDIIDGQITRETVHFDLEEFCSQLDLDIGSVRSVAQALNGSAPVAA